MSKRSGPFVDDEGVEFYVYEYDYSTIGRRLALAPVRALMGMIMFMGWSYDWFRSRWEEK